MKARNKDERSSRWNKSQELLVLWRSQNPITDRDPSAQYDRVAAWLRKHIDPGRLLDVGCKTGGLRKSTLYPQRLEYHGIDPLVIPGGGYDFPFKAITVEQMHMHYEGCFFDAVLIKDSVDYFADCGLALVRIREVLKKPDGLLLLSEADHQSRAGHARSRTRSTVRHIRTGIRRLLRKNGIGRIGTRLRQMWDHQGTGATRNPILSVPAKIDYHDTYPNGDLSIRVIKSYLRSAGFSIVESTISRGRLQVVARVR